MRCSTWTVPWRRRPAARLYDMAAADKMLIQGFHFPFPALGYVEKDGSGLSPRAGVLESRR